MSVLSDVDLKLVLSSGDLVIVSDTSKWKIQPASIDLTLYGEFLQFPKTTPYNQIMEPSEPVPMERLTQDYYLLRPGQFVLGCTEEYIHVPKHLAGRIEGKSSLGRLGQIVHITAGYIDPGFRGQLTLEFYNAAPRPFMLRAGMPICQVSFMQMLSESVSAYDGKYQNASGPQESRYWQNFVKEAAK